MIKDMQKLSLEDKEKKERENRYNKNKEVEIVNEDDKMYQDRYEKDLENFHVEKNCSSLFSRVGLKEEGSENIDKELEDIDVKDIMEVMSVNLYTPFMFSTKMKDWLEKDNENC